MPLKLNILQDRAYKTDLNSMEKPDFSMNYIFDQLQLFSFHLFLKPKLTDYYYKPEEIHL